jgi:glycosyltransferase involved in cell wall biosynthesis
MHGFNEMLGISVIMPAYNRPGLIGETLRSLLRGLSSLIERMQYD